MKRIAFILVLLILCVVCIYKMNEQYDELARYPHVLNEAQRTLVLDKLDTDEINYLVSQKIEPEQFLPYLEQEDFILRNTLWYDLAMNTQKTEVKEVITFINQYRDKIAYEHLEAYLTHYSYNELMRFFDMEQTLSLCVNPKDPYLVIGEQESIFTYEPKGLVLLKDLKVSDKLPLKKHYLRENVIPHLKTLLKNAKQSNNLTNGNLEVICGYLSYEQQLSLLEDHHPIMEQVKLQAGGQSELQLGYSVLISFKEEKKLSKEKNERAYQDALSYLKDQCAKHGFTIRNIYEKRLIELRYVGLDLAMALQEQKLTLEEIDLTKFRQE